MTTRLDARQSRQRALLDQLSPNTDVKLDILLNLMNDEITPPLRLRAANPNTLQLFVDSISVTTSDSGDGHLRTKTIQPISGILPSFTPGNITFPGTSGGSITATGLTLAAAYTLTLPSSNWLKCLIALNADGQIVLSFGDVAVSEAAAIIPVADAGTFAIGYASLQNVSGTIQNVMNSRIYQFSGGGGSGSGSGSGTFRNYLDAWFDASKSFSINNGGVSATGNRSALATLWASTNTSNWTMARNTSGVLRGTYSYAFSGGTGAVNGSVFVESPTFVLDIADSTSNTAGFGPLNLYVSMDVDTRTVDMDAVLVRYNAAGTYQETIAISGMNSLSAATVPSQNFFPATGTPFNRYFGFAQTSSIVSGTDRYALRIRSLAVVASIVPRIDSIYVGPNADFGVTDQRYVGNKQFADGLQAREGVNIPNTLDFPTTLTVASGESKIVGRLVVATGTTITVNGDLGCIGALTGPGLVNGSGVITSF